MLVAGGGPSTTDARVIDFNGATPQVTPTAPMAYGRRQHNLTVLADGTRPRHGRQLVRRPARRPERTASTPPSNGTPPRASGGRSPRCRSRASTTRPRCCCPTGACCPRAAASAARATRSATWPRTREIFSPPYLFQADGTLAPRPVDRLRARVDDLRRALADRHAEPGLDPQGRPRPARRGHALGQHGAALRAAVLHGRARRRSPRPRRPTPTSRRRASTCCSSSTRTACRRSRAW